MRVLIYILIFILVNSHLNAQPPVVVKKLTDNYAADHTTIDIVLDSMVAWHEQSPELVKILATKIIIIAKAEKDTFAVIKSANELGNMFKLDGEWDSALDFYKQASSLGIGDNIQYAITPLMNIGQIQVGRGEYMEADLAYRRADSLLHCMTASRSRLYDYAQLYANYGDLFLKLGAYDSSLLRFGRATELALKIGNEEILGGIYNSVGTLFSDYLDRCDSAIRYYKKALPLYKQQRYNLGYGLLLYNIADCFRKQGMYDSAIVWNEQSLEVLSQEDSLYLSYPLSLLATLKVSEGKSASAIALYENCISIAQWNKATEMEADYESGLGEVYTRIGQYYNALKWYNKALLNFQQIGVKKKIYPILQSIARVYYQLQDYKAAAMYYSKAIIAYEAYLNEESVKSSQRAYILYQQPMRDLLESQQQKTIENEREIRKRRTIENYLLIGGIALVAFAAFLIYGANRQVKAKNRELEAQKKVLAIRNSIIEAQKETILHTNKDYIRILETLFEPLAWENDVPEIVVEKYSRRIKRLYKHLEMIYSGEHIAGANEEDVNVNYTAFLSAYCREMAETFSIVIEMISLQPVLIPASTAAIVTLIVDELTINAITHSGIIRSQGKITIAIQRDDNILHLIVKDNGKGLPVDVDAKDKRHLYIVKSLVQKKYGSLKAESNGGTTFFITLYI